MLYTITPTICLVCTGPPTPGSSLIKVLSESAMYIKSVRIVEIFPAHIGKMAQLRDLAKKVPGKLAFPFQFGCLYSRAGSGEPHVFGPLEPESPEKKIRAGARAD